MRSTGDTATARAASATIAEGHQMGGPDGGDETDAVDGRRRRWYHVRPQPRRRSDLMGFNSIWWTVVWVVVVVLAVVPYPLW